MTKKITSISKTAGQVLSEDRLRAFAQCSKFFNYGGSQKLNLPTQVLSDTVRNIISSSIRSEESVDGDKALIKAAYRLVEFKELIEQDREDLLRKTRLVLAEFLSLFDFEQYYPIFGPLRYRTRVSKTPIDLEVAGIFRKKWGGLALHVIDFVPYSRHHDIVNDLVSHIKLRTLGKFVKKSGTRRSDVYIHLFNVSKTYNLSSALLTEEDTSDQYVNQIEPLIKQIESGFCFPVSPCNYTCIYKHRCFPHNV